MKATFRQWGRRVKHTALMKPELILVIEDDLDIAHLLKLDLEGAGYRVSHAANTVDGLAQFRAGNPDLLLLDLGLPDGLGHDVISQVRATGTVPIIVLTARGMTEEKVEVLELGANDYVTKPYVLNEMLARIAVQFRRVQPVATLACGELRLIPERSLAIYREAEIPLSNIEFKILAFLMRSPGRVYSQEEMSGELWSHGLTSGSNVLNVHISHVRSKFKGVGGHGLIRNGRGVGFALTT